MRTRSRHRHHATFPIAAVLAATLAAPVAAQIPGIGPQGPIRRIDQGFQFTEGPAQDAAGNLYFSDVRGNAIYKIDTNSRRTTFLSPSGNANGIWFDRTDRMLVCQHAGRVVRIDTTTKAVTVLAGTFNGRAFNSPNDIVADVHGGFYFTDPPFGGNRQDKQGVYYRAPNGNVTRVIDNLLRPNGIMLSRQEHVLYVASSTPAAIMAYDVRAPGVLGPGRSFFQLGSATVDGMTIDSKGNLYLTRPSLSAIEVVTPLGRSLGRFTVAERPSNCAFGGPSMRTLFITARTSVYAATMLSTGHRPMRGTASRASIPVGGGSVDLALVTTPILAGRSYVIVGSASGSLPGVVLDSTRIPVNVDAFTSLALALVNSPIFARFGGRLDAAGGAGARLTMPALPASAIGARLSFAGALLGPIDGAGNALTVEITR